MGVKGNIHPKRESEIKKDLGNRNLLVYVVSGIGVGSQGVKKNKTNICQKNWASDGQLSKPGKDSWICIILKNYVEP